jgi:hypothetical protein
MQVYIYFQDNESRKIPLFSLCKPTVRFCFWETQRANESMELDVAISRGVGVPSSLEISSEHSYEISLAKL